MKINTIYYNQLGPCGLFNQVLTLETAVAIQHKADADVILYGNQNAFAISKPSNYDIKYKDMICPQESFKIDDIFSWESQDRFVFDSILREDQIKNVTQYNMSKCFLVDIDKEIKNIDEFAGTRYPFYINGENINFTNTLVSYSYFIYHREKELDKKISSVSAHKEYVDLAKKIAISLGEFDGIHARMTDFPIYIYRVTKEMFHEAIKYFNSGRKLVISTDDPDNHIFQSLGNSAIFLDKYIYENFYNEFKNLPINNEIVFGLINNLVMHYSKDFIGTLGSTYTSYIQKGRVNMGLTPSWKFFDDLNYQKNGTYSWTGYPVADNAKGWWREWEECLLIKD